MTLVTLAAADGAGGSSWAYTFNQWDNHSAVIDPITKAATALPGNIKLLSHEWELAMMNDIRQRDGGQYDECLPITHRAHIHVICIVTNMYQYQPVTLHVTVIFN